MKNLLRSVINVGSRAHRNVIPSPMPRELEALNSYSMSGLPVLKKLFSIAEDAVARGVDGDFVECGVCNGGSAAAIARALRDTERHVWLYDSFEGVPEPKEIDGGVASEFGYGAWKGDEKRVMEAMRIAGLDEKQYTIRKGWFEDTFSAPLARTIAILHIDADWHESVSLALNTFYDLVSEGGVILLDDFGHWEGCREAFYDFISQRNLKPLLERFGHTQAFWIKGREHNRDFVGKWAIP